jgi:hypothetical protein
MFDPVDAADCNENAEALFIDGANGVCRDVRLEAGRGRSEGVELALGFVVAVAVLAAWFRRAAPRVRALVVVAAASLAAMPGMWALGTRRADRPTAVRDTAAVPRALHDALRAHAEAWGCAEITVHGCPSCEPVGRLALAGLRCDDPAAIELHPGAFDGVCEASGAVLRCGAAR